MLLYMIKNCCCKEQHEREKEDKGKGLVPSNCEEKEKEYQKHIEELERKIAELEEHRCITIQDLRKLLGNEFPTKNYIEGKPQSSEKKPLWPQLL